MEITISITWLIVGFIFVAIEVFGIPSAGFLFGGLAAILMAILIEGNIIAGENLPLTLGIWFFITAVIGAFLWSPIKKWRTTKHSATTTNNGMIGDRAVILTKDLNPNELGNASWSGTIMNARLDSSVTHPIAVGTECTIVRVEGNTLILSTL